MYNGMLIQDLDIANVSSERRNPIIANVMAQLDYMEKRGSGLSRICNETVKKHSIDDEKKHRNKPSRLSDAEMITYNVPHRRIQMSETFLYQLYMQALQAHLNQNIMNVDVIGRGPLVTKIAIGMLCIFNLTNSNSAITAVTHNQTKVLLFAQ